MSRRSRPLLVAPFIPLLGIIGIFGLEELHGSHYFVLFVVIWCALLAALFVFVLNKALQARKNKVNS